MNAYQTKETIPKLILPSKKIQRIAEGLIADCNTDEAKIEALHDFVRDDIVFGFPKKWIPELAEDVIEEGIGYCNSKALLFCELCRGVGYPAKIHFADIKTEIMYGIFPDWMLNMAPPTNSHAWVEVFLNGQWQAIDTFILDLSLFRRAKLLLLNSGRNIGYGLAHTPEAPCARYWTKGFHQMGAVDDVLGKWDDAAAFYKSPFYQKLPKWINWTYPILRFMVNRKVAKIRKM